MTEDIQISRQLWILAMAGGASCIAGWDGEHRGDPLPHPNYFKTFFTFWEDRFLKDMVRDNNLTDGWCLKTPDNMNFVFYKENTSSLSYNVSSMSGSQRVVAIDAKGVYSEADLGAKPPGSYTFNAPYSSDWAVAAGNFAFITDSTPPTIISNMLLPENLDLRVFPNPFKVNASINFKINKRQNVNLRIFNLKGELIQILLDKQVEQGNHAIKWNNTVSNSGVFIARLQCNKKIHVTKLMVLK